jgi:hypothetical protein
LDLEALLGERDHELGGLSKRQTLRPDPFEISFGNVLLLESFANERPLLLEGVFAFDRFGRPSFKKEQRLFSELLHFFAFAFDLDFIFAFDLDFIFAFDFAFFVFFLCLL